MERHPLTTKHERDPTEAEREMQLIEAIAATGLDRARRYEREIDDGTAAVIATGISRLRTVPSPRLDHFARYGHGRNDELRDEYLDVYNQPTTAPRIKEWIDWLGTHLLHRDDDYPWNAERFEELLSEAKEHIFVNNHKAGIGLLDVLTDWAPTADYIEDDLNRLEADPKLDATDRIRFVWLRAMLLSYSEEDCDGTCK